MNHKTNGFLLFEFLITSLLATTLLIIVYQSYRTANQGVQYIKNNADFQMQKILFQYQLELDAMHIFIPDFIYDLYPKIKNYFNKQTEQPTPNKTDREINSSQNNDNQKKKLENEFKLASIFFPELIHTAEEIKISWISSRKILGKSSFVKINYIIKLTDKRYKEQKLYSLYRREDSLEKDFSIKKNGKEYTFITYIVNPEIAFITPKINTVSEKSLENNKKESNDFFNWTENPLFITEQATTPIKLKDMLNRAIIPFALIINGTMIAYNFSKELDIQITAGFPIADYALQILFNADIKQPTNSPDDNKDKKIENTLPKPVNKPIELQLI
jgi:hypothetical protein